MLPVIPDDVQSAFYYKSMEYLYFTSNHLVLFVSVTFCLICLALKGLFGCFTFDHKPANIKVLLADNNISLY